MRFEARPLALLFALLGGMGGCCGSAQAGPVLICHPLEVEKGVDLLPWKSTKGFRGTAPGLTPEEVVSKTLALLDGKRPLFARMETMRRASLALESERGQAQRLLDAVVARTRERAEDPLAWFDAGVLAAGYEQAAWYFRQKGGEPSLRGADARAFLARALERSGGDPRIQLAQALAEARHDERRTWSHFAAAQAAVAEGRGGEVLERNVRRLAHGGMREVFVAPPERGRDM